MARCGHRVGDLICLKRYDTVLAVPGSLMVTVDPVDQPGVIRTKSLDASGIVEEVVVLGETGGNPAKRGVRMAGTQFVEGIDVSAVFSHRVDDKPLIVSRRVAREHHPALIETERLDGGLDPLGLLVLQKVRHAWVFDQDLRCGDHEQVRKDRTGHPSRQGPSELRELRILEEENKKLKQLVADLSLDKAMLQEVIEKKL